MARNLLKAALTASTLNVSPTGASLAAGVSYDNTRDHAETIREIIKRLNRIAGDHPRSIFRNWLSLVEAGLTSPKELAASLGQLAEKYHPDYLPEFIAAMELLKASVNHGYYDTIGSIYMQFAFPNPGTGQYFTPWNICLMMGAMTIGDGKKLIIDRLREAAEKAAAENPAMGTLLQAGAYVALTCENGAYLMEKFLPAVLPYYEPFTVCDPCVGSGVMLLAGAAQFPDWAIRLGLVQFYGQDIDPDCVKMCRINVLLYGLNGSRCDLTHRFALDADTCF